MLVQEADDKILLLPAWPADWDADFKLHLTKETVIQGTVVDGRLSHWSIDPAERKEDVVVHQPQVVPARPIIPHNDHPLRIGTDHAGGSRFQGRIGRVTIFRGLLKHDMIGTLAAGQRDEKVKGETVVDCLLDPKVGDTLTITPGALDGEVSFEAWIQPAKGEAGRIFDKITAGKQDGLLIDCWPDLSLRVINGSRQEDFPNVLKPGIWQHLVVVFAKGRIGVYLNGDKLL
jgi:hypothetical protein